MRAGRWGTRHRVPYSRSAPARARKPRDWSSSDGRVQPRGDRFAHVDRQGQSTVMASFAMHHHLCGPPVQIIRPQPRYFCGTNAATEQHDNHCVVVSPTAFSTVVGARLPRFIFDRFYSQVQAHALQRSWLSALVASSLAPDPVESRLLTAHARPVPTHRRDALQCVGWW
jgi:hypothetical protein